MKKIFNVFFVQYHRSTFNAIALRKTIFQGIFFSSVLMFTPFLGMAQTGSYNGSPSGDSYISNIISSHYQNSLHFGSSFFTGNTLNITGGDLTGGSMVSGHESAFGGWSRNSTVIGNTVNISGGTVNRVFAGWSNSADAIGNTINITDTATIMGRAFAGRSSSGNSMLNRVIMTGGTVHGNLTAGRSHSGNVTNNLVTISGGILNGIASGARSNGTAYVASNVIDISGGTFNSHVFGAYANRGIGLANQVNITGGTFKGHIYGSHSTTGTLTNNIVTITGGGATAVKIESTSNIYGADADTGTVTGNSVFITDVDLNGNNIAGAYSASGAVSSNNVTFNSDESHANLNISGGKSLSSAVTGNQVAITTGTFTGDTVISGGSSVSGAITDNQVAIADGTFTDTDIYGGNSTSGTVTGNEVTINGGTFKTGSTISGGHSTSGEVTGNHVIINGGLFETGSVITGGYVDNNTSNVHGNVVSILDTANLSGAILTGGSNSSGHDAATSLYTDNRLIIKANTKVHTVKNFQHYEFHLDGTDTTPMLDTEDIHLGDGAHVYAYLGDRGENIGVGTTIQLLADQDTDHIEGNLASATALQGLSIVHILETQHTGTKVNLFVAGSQAHPHSRTFPEARLASFSFMNQANDLIVGQGMASSIDAASTKPEEWVGFAALSIGSSQYSTENGATGDVRFGGMSLVTGAAKIMPLDSASFLTGAYFEAGHGSIDTDNNNDNRSSVYTNGDSNYYGIGILGRYELNNGFYGEGFMRLGILETKMRTHDNRYTLENDSSSAYYGVGASFGYQLALFDKRDMLDVYTRYIWTHLVDEDIRMDSHDYHFDDVNSHQVRVGAQYNITHNKFFSPFIGLAAQYEFDGESRADIDGRFDVTRPDITGFTGLLELGVRLLPDKDIPFTTSMNFEAYVGTRKGVNVTLNMGYYF